MSSLAAVSDEQYKSILDDEIALLARKFHALYKFHKERRRSPKGYFECGDTTTSSPTAPSGRSLTPPISTTTPTRTTTAKGDRKKKNRFGDKKKKLQKIMF
jgi:hypothetical protein